MTTPLMDVPWGAWLVERRRLFRDLGFMRVGFPKDMKRGERAWRSLCRRLPVRLPAAVFRQEGQAAGTRGPGAAAACSGCARCGHLRRSWPEHG